MISVEILNWWLRFGLWYLQCLCTGDMAVFHWAQQKWTEGDDICSRNRNIPLTALLYVYMDGHFHAGRHGSMGPSGDIKHYYHGYFGTIMLTLARPITEDVHFLSAIRKRQFSVHTLNSPSAAYMSRWIGPALVQIMTCQLLCAKPLSKTMLGYCQLDP